jgi:hypothetical protein
LLHGAQRGVMMRRLVFLILFLSTIGLVAPSAAVAEPATGQIALVGRAPDNPDVDGVRLSIIYGKNRRMSGLDLGFFSMSESQEMSGAAFVFGFHRLTGAMDGGAAFSLVNIHEGNDSGLNAAFLNMLDSAEGAVDLGFVNIASGNTLVDIGAVNVADETKAQLGFVNVAKKIKGLQLGFINVADNGFLKVFPFFNFPKSGD